MYYFNTKPLLSRRLDSFYLKILYKFNIKMEKLTDLKAILHSKRCNLYVLEHCRVMQKDGRVLFLTEHRDENCYWNIPIANTTFILLSTGTSITQAAMRLLASAGVVVGFAGSGGTPLIQGVEVEWLTPQGEYRPTEYLQNWMSFWFDDDKRLTTAKYFQTIRLSFLEKIWLKDRDLATQGVVTDETLFKGLLAGYRRDVASSLTVSNLLLTEASLTKKLYKHMSVATKMGTFTRDQEGGTAVNELLNHGNYLAYGLAATCLWTLGIPHGFAVMHGKTRRGALVFDVADLIKDAIILPWAFICAKEKLKEQEFRDQVIQKFAEHKVLDFMFETVKSASEQKF